MKLPITQRQQIWTAAITAAVSFALGFSCTRYFSNAKVTKTTQLQNYQAATGRLQRQTQNLYLGLLSVMDDLNPGSKNELADSQSSYRQIRFVPSDS